MEKNLFCYVLEKDIPEDSKLSEDNKNCISCAYTSVCERDITGKSNKIGVEKEEKVVKVKPLKEKVVKEKVVKEKVVKEKVVKEKKPKKKKTSLEDLALMDDGDIF